MAKITITGLTDLQANAMAMWAESGGLADAFEESKEASFLTDKWRDLGNSSVSYDPGHNQYMPLSHEVRYGS